MTTATAAIASHLSIAESIVASVEEWANVLFVRLVGRRPRFVSKKVVEEKSMYPESAETTMYCNPESLRGVRTGDTFRSPDNKAVYRVTEIKKEYFVWEKNGVEYTEYPGGYCDEKYKVEVVGTFFKMVQPR